MLLLGFVQVYLFHLGKDATFAECQQPENDIKAAIVVFNNQGNNENSLFIATICIDNSEIELNFHILLIYSSFITLMKLLKHQLGNNYRYFLDAPAPTLHPRFFAQSPAIPFFRVKDRVA